MLKNSLCLVAAVDAINALAYKGQLSGNLGRTDQIRAIYSCYSHLVLAADACQQCNPLYACGIPLLARLGQSHLLSSHCC